MVKDQKLKSFHFKKNGNCYEVVHKSGQLEVLSNAGNSYNTTVPIELPSPTGRQLKLVWTHSGEQPRLQKIQDGSDVLLNIEYSDALVKITQTPGTAEASTLALACRGGRLIEFRLPLDGSPSWMFEYDQTPILQKSRALPVLRRTSSTIKKAISSPEALHKITSPMCLCTPSCLETASPPSRPSTASPTRIFSSSAAALTGRMETTIYTVRVKTTATRQRCKWTEERLPSTPRTDSISS